MKNENEELIQQLIEDQLQGAEIGNQQLNNQDAEVYQVLFKELSDTSYVANDFNLADDVIREISRKEEKAESVKYSVIIFMIIVTGLIVAYLSIILVSPALIQIIFNKMITHKEICLFIILSLSVIQVLDKIFIKKSILPLNVS